MAGWRLKRGMPEWHQVMNFTDVVRGVVITAQTEDCDGDREFWWVKEDGILVAEGESHSNGDAQKAAERVICWGVLPLLRRASAGIEVREVSPDLSRRAG